MANITNLKGTDKLREAYPVINQNLAVLNAENEQQEQRIDNLVGQSGSSNTEIVDARQSTIKNQTFTVLKDRLEDIETDITEKLDKSGGAMAGDLDMGSHKVSNLAAPVSPDDAARKVDIDAKAGILDLNSYPNVFVDPATGNDATGVANDNTKPFATIKGAVENTVGNVQIILFPGTHYINASFSIQNRKVGIFGDWGSSAPTIQKADTNVSIYCNLASVSIQSCVVVFDGNLFLAGQNCTFNFGGFYAATFRPNTNSDCNIIFTSSITPGDNGKGADILVVVGYRFQTQTSTVAGYNKVFNIIGFDAIYFSPVIFVKLIASNKDATVKWVNGSDAIQQLGTSTTYFY